MITGDGLGPQGLGPLLVSGDAEAMHLADVPVVDPKEAPIFNVGHALLTLYDGQWGLLAQDEATLLAMLQAVPSALRPQLATDLSVHLGPGNKVWNALERVQRGTVAVSKTRVWIGAAVLLAVGGIVGVVAVRLRRR